MDTLPLARRIIERLDDYEQHPDDYDDGSRRVLKDSASRADYVHYYRAQAENYITSAYASLGDLDNMSKAYKQIENIFTEATAREHVARYNALQKQLEIERKDAELSRKNIITAALAIGFLTLLAFMSYVLRQHRILKRKNRVLAHEIAEAVKYRDMAYSHQAEESPVPREVELSDLTNEELFQYIREVVMRDKLFLDPALNRQQLTERFSLSKERLGAAFAQGSPFKSFTDFINDYRLLYAAKLLTEHPDLSIAEVAEASGFARAATFIDNFKKRFALTPTQYRTQNLV